MNPIMPGGNNGHPGLPHHGRRHDNYYHLQQYSQHMQYHHPVYNMTPQRYYAQHQPYQAQWYPHPYQQAYMQPAPPQHRSYQPQSPMIVSSHPHGPHGLPYSRHQSYHAPSPSNRTPQTLANPQEPPSTPPVPTSAAPSPANVTPTTSTQVETPPAHPAQASSEATPSTPPPPQAIPFYPKLPWYSVPESDFPQKTPRRRRKRRTLAQTVLELPRKPQSPDDQQQQQQQIDSYAVPTPSETEQSLLSAAPSDAASTDATTPTSPVLPAPSTVLTGSKLAVSIEPAEKSSAKAAPRSAVPVAPALPLIASPVEKSSPVSEETRSKTPTPQTAQPANDASPQQPADSSEAAVESVATLAPTPAPKPPSSWAALLRTKAKGADGASAGPTSTSVANGFPVPKTATLGDALRSYDVDDEGKLSYLEPRGLINTGNMCYMNSILQILVFCTPFYQFLDLVAKRAVHSFKSDTPLIESMIMFMREFNTIDAATSSQQLRLRLKDKELEQYGDSFIPEYVYETINRLPRFSSMRRGHQQDAEEFLGFLLEGLHDECAKVMISTGSESTGSLPSSTPLAADTIPGSSAGGEGWLEVGPKQKPAVTRSSGMAAMESPITKIFGGKLRSEFRVPGLKNSVTLEPYQPLQLDIGDPKVSNILDALRGLTRSETIHGEFSSPRGPGAVATKQVFIETLPPVLILHLKRFQYDNTGGTQKIWKKVGYPLDLEIPKEVFSQSRRAQLAMRPGGLPKYRLISVVYHHGKNASGGHYTVDVRRQDGTEWIRLDDTVIRRVRAEDVAKEGGEEDPKVLAAALQNHKRDASAGANIYKAAGFDAESDDGGTDDGLGWSQVNGGTMGAPNGKDTNNKKWSSLLNGTSSAGTVTPSTAGKQTPKETSKYSVKDNKVAYILFYERINT